jgi:hypothetical protein
MLPLCASVGIAVTIGLILSWGVALRRISSVPHLILLGSLAVALGLGVSSCFYFLWLLIFGPGTGGLALAELGFLGCLIAVLFVSRRASHSAPAPVGVPNADPRAPPLLSWGFAFACVSALGGFLAISLRNPHGAWDAWMTWNMHARFIFRGGNNWLVMFSDSSSLRHPDYPFLVPSLVARGWSYAGSELLTAPILLALLFTFATVALVCSALAILRMRSQGLLAGLVLVGTPFFITHGASQYADVPVGLYFAATLVLLCLHDRHGASTRGFLLLAGLTAGLAAWTKNEGLLFLIALAVARSIAVGPVQGWRTHGREMRVLAAGLLPVLLIIIFFKLQIAAANDLVSSSSQGMQSTLDRLLDPHRYIYIAKNFANMILAFGSNGFVSAGWLLLTYLVCVGPKRGSEKTAGVRTGLLMLALILSGHVFVYLTAPSDMPRLLDSSLERVLLQLWPGVLFMYFMIARTPEEAVTPFASETTSQVMTHEVGRIEAPCLSQTDVVAQCPESIGPPIPIEGALKHDPRVLLERLDSLQDP